MREEFRGCVRATSKKFDERQGPEKAWLPHARAQFQHSSFIPGPKRHMANSTAPLDRKKPVLVLGGNGFVGSAICKLAVEKNIPVVSLSRRGKPEGPSQEWMKSVTWLQGDVFKLDQREDKILHDIQGVISCVGGFGSNEQMERICGDATVVAADAAAKAGVSRFVFISAHDYNSPSFILPGYFRGKRKAEAAIQKHFPNNSLILRPGFIFGRRAVGSVVLPLDFIGAPMRWVFNCVPSQLASLPIMRQLLLPPVRVEAVAAAALAGVTDPKLNGVLEVRQIDEFDPYKKKIEN